MVEVGVVGGEIEERERDEERWRKREKNCKAFEIRRENNSKVMLSHV